MRSRRASHRLPGYSTVAISLSFVLGCATSLQVTGNRLKSDRSFGTVYLVGHAGESRGVDVSIQSNLFRRGYIVTTGTEGSASTHTDFVVRYMENWSWDMGFYLRSASILFYDGWTGALIGSGEWRNSGLHGFQHVDSVVDQIITAIFQRIGLDVMVPVPEPGSRQ
jgi:hypothetical protein